ncbi:MAG TPA: His-Xaa-Ser system protein HxsD [Myxococcota bacterium]|nr:His-Xaa-Ser system protein HxsD [Myxococcota bacterium]HNZ02725.1 His-Xaa-Ser system protein HxsD [Myxococcota bacterium]HOD06908.1 His-Xaa-Ser system protein HxsD [Myxococcota bacterium]HPB50185.1 His-Xaa-Ser system protein HxsD [Myxococcota bacterium]HQP95033.1 His-Xaa-Ser system protein HxsD [Myxococcota bacterium]
MPAKKADSRSEFKATVKGDSAVIRFHKSLYSTDALFGTAFVFLDRCYVHCDLADDDHIEVVLTPRTNSKWSLAELAGEFKNEMVNQALRFKLARQTEKVRTMIVGRAIGESIPPDGQQTPAPIAATVPDLPPEVAKLLSEEEESLDFLDDPFGIAIPWEEKYKKDESARGEGGKQ